MSFATAKEAVNKALAFVNANPTTGGARALSRVLLHAYNQHDYPLDITDLCVLDSNMQKWAWLILQLRVNGVEPHTVADNWEDFSKLIERNMAR